MPKITSLSKGTKVFLDANIFLYVFTNHPRFCPASQAILTQVENDHISGYTSHLVLMEVTHKLMCGEVSQTYRIPLPKTVTYLKNNPQVIKNLSKYKIGLQQIKSIPHLTILEVTPKIFDTAWELIERFCLLSSDAVHTATCQFNQIKDIATNDSDFKRVSSLKVWTP